MKKKTLTAPIQGAWQILTVGSLQTLVGKTIEWTAPSAKENAGYTGVDKILNIVDDRRPLVCESISGDELKYAFIDDLIDNEVLSYSDSYRVVTYRIV